MCLFPGPVYLNINPVYVTLIKLLAVKNVSVIAYLLPFPVHSSFPGEFYVKTNN